MENCRGAYAHPGPDPVNGGLYVNSRRVIRRGKYRTTSAHTVYIPLFLRQTKPGGLRGLNADVCSHPGAQNTTPKV